MKTQCSPHETISSKSKRPWEWSLEEIKDKVNCSIHTGRSLQPKQWPNGAKVAVGFSVDVDNETEHLANADQNKLESLFLSCNQYGARRGVGRMANTFDRYNVPCTFFIPAISGMLAPHMFDDILKSGLHEIAAHGWIHESPDRLSEEEHRELLGKAQQYLTEMTGNKPIGYRAPLAVFADHTLPLLKELGFLYDSTFCADDSPYELLMNDASPSSLIELPASLTQEDGAFLTFENDWSNGMLSPADLLQIHKDSFDVAYDEGTMVLFIMHPHVSGRRSRMAMVERLIQYMQSKSSVWFATHEQIALHVKKEFDL